MIVLPNTPPTPKPWNPANSVLSPGILAARASIGSPTSTSHADSVRYVVKLEEYLEAIFALLAAQNHETTLAQVALDSSASVLCSAIPWSNLAPKRPRMHDLARIRSAPQVEWTLASEIQAVAVAAAFMYLKLGAELLNELIEAEDGAEPQNEVDEKWKLVAGFYKKAAALADFGAEFTAAALTDVLVNPAILVLLTKIAGVGIQMSILCKFSWINRNSFNAQDTFLSKNNGVLCRVAIWVLDETKSCLNIVGELEALADFVDLNYSGWTQYLSIFVKYACAYAGLFLSIEYYQKNKLGQAIGLINFSLVSLQSKNLSEIRPKKAKVFSQFKSRIAGKRNGSFIAGLQSTTALKIDKSAFLELSGVVLKDLSLLFDQLVQCHLKYTKENDNLNFDEVAHWKDIHTDLKWPFGSQIPVSPLDRYVPRALQPVSGAGPKSEFSGRGSYF